MGMINKTVTGITEDLKLVKNGKQAPKAAQGGTARPKFSGSNDTRAAGAPGPNQILASATGYIDQGAVSIGDTSHSRSFTKAGNRGSLAGAVTPANESVTGGMGGKFIKNGKANG
jgi:hypothetical protein